jgi:hypothetical protein
MTSRRREDPRSPLAVELEEVPWPHRFNATTLPQYHGESDPREFLLKYEASMESNGGGSAIKAKAFVMAVKGSARNWYASIPKGQIYSWSQLRSKLLTNCKQHEKETLQEYMHIIIKLRAKAPNVADLTVIEAAIARL